MPLLIPLISKLHPILWSSISNLLLYLMYIILFAYVLIKCVLLYSCTYLITCSIFLPFILSTLFLRPIHAAMCIIIQFLITGASLVAQTAKKLPVMWETPVGSPGWEDSLVKRMATHFSIPA